MGSYEKIFCDARVSIFLKILKIYNSFLRPGSYWTKGCLTEYVESIDSYGTILISTIVIFTIFTALTIGFVIVLLLYHDGVGHMVSEQKVMRESDSD